MVLSTTLDADLGSGKEFFGAGEPCAPALAGNLLVDSHVGTTNAEIPLFPSRLCSSQLLSHEGQENPVFRKLPREVVRASLFASRFSSPFSGPLGVSRVR